MPLSLVFNLPKALILGYFLGSVSVSISDPSKNDFLSLQSLPGEPTSAHRFSSGVLFGTQGADFKKRGSKNEPQNRTERPKVRKCLVPSAFCDCSWSRLGSLSTPKAPKASFLSFFHRFGFHFGSPWASFLCIFQRFRPPFPKFVVVFSTDFEHA